MKLFNKKSKLAVLLIFLTASVFFLTACSSSGGSGSSVPDSVVTEVDSLDDLNKNLDSNIGTVELKKDIEGDAEIKTRTKDLVINLNGKTLKGNLTLTQRINKKPWNLSFAGEGTITKALTVNDPALSVTINKGIEVSGTTTINNVARNSFNNKGILNEVVIKDNDGITFHNEGIINKEITIGPSKFKPSVSKPIKITGELNNKKININVSNTTINLEAKTNSVTLNITGSNNNIYYSDEITVNNSGNSNTIEQINRSISGTVSADYDNENTEVLLISTDKGLGDLSPEEADDIVDLDKQNEYVFNNVNPGREYYIFAYNDENNNGIIDLDLLGRDPEASGTTDPLGFYGNYPNKVSVGKNEHLKDCNITITKNAIGLLVSSSDNSSINLSTIQAELYKGPKNQSKQPLVITNNLLETRSEYLAFFTGLEKGDYYWKVKADGYQEYISEIKSLGRNNNIIHSKITLNK